METLIDIDGAMFTSEAATLADGTVAALLADAVVLTRVGVAVLAIVTPLAAQLGWTLAVVVILEIDTLGTVQTWAGGAGVQVILARGAGETWGTRAYKATCGQLQTRAAILTGLLPTGSWLLESITLELNVRKPLELGHGAVTVDVERDGHVVQPDVIHAADKAPANIDHVTGRALGHLCSKVDIRLVKVEDIIETRGCSVCPPLAVHGQLCTVAMPLQLDLVPLPVTDHEVHQGHHALPAPKVEPVLELAAHNLQDAVVHNSLSKHQSCRLVQSSESQAEAQMSLQRALDGILSVAVTRELERIDN